MTVCPHIGDLDWFRCGGGKGNSNPDQLAASFAGAAVDFNEIVWSHGPTERSALEAYGCQWFSRQGCKDINLEKVCGRALYLSRVWYVV